jgi:hypothetical protein
MLAQGNYTFAIVAVEHFMKWVEVKPVTNITSATIKKFFEQNIIDNPKNFDSDVFKGFCHQVRMKVAFTSVYHTQ